MSQKQRVRRFSVRVAALVSQKGGYYLLAKIRNTKNI